MDALSSAENKAHDYQSKVETMDDDLRKSVTPSSFAIAMAPVLSQYILMGSSIVGTMPSPEMNLRIHTASFDASKAAIYSASVDEVAKILCFVLFQSTIWRIRVKIIGFVDSDYAKDPDKGRSITGYAFLVQGCVVSWKATLQHVVALSTTEAEYMALTEAVKEAIWLRGLLEELGVELNTVAVNCDNQGAIHLSRNHVFHERTKHINVRYHFIREVLEAKTVKVLKVGTEHNAADALTKVVPGLKLQHCLELLNVGVG
ncbi:hypothetical protein Tco_1037553 [Tanacetum coccineum]